MMKFLGGLLLIVLVFVGFLFVGTRSISKMLPKPSDATQTTPAPAAAVPTPTPKTVAAAPEPAEAIAPTDASGPTDDEIRENRRRLWDLVKESVTRQLKSPSTATFGNDGWTDAVEPSGVTYSRVLDAYIVDSYVDSQNSFGAMVRTPIKLAFRLENGQFKEASAEILADMERSAEALEAELSTAADRTAIVKAVEDKFRETLRGEYAIAPDLRDYINLNGDSATVKSSYERNGETRDFTASLVKVGDTWRVRDIQTRIRR